MHLTVTPPGIFAQIYVTVLRVLLQQLRNPLAALFEILLPVVIVAGLAALSTLSPTEIQRGVNFVPGSSSPRPAVALSMVLPSVICYNDGFRPSRYTGSATADPTEAMTMPDQLGSDPHARKMLLPCSAFYPNATHPDTRQPMKDVSDWVCSDDKPRWFVAPKGLCGFFRRESPIAAATSALTAINLIPSVDDMLLAQWAARIVQPFAMPDFLDRPVLSRAVGISGAVYVVAETPAQRAAAQRLVAGLNYSSSLFRGFAFAGVVDSMASLSASVFSNFTREGSTWAVLRVKRFGGAAEAEADRGLDVLLQLNRSAVGWTVQARQRGYSGGPLPWNQLFLASGFLSLERAIGNAYANYISSTGAAGAPTTITTTIATTTGAAVNATFSTGGDDTYALSSSSSMLSMGSFGGITPSGAELAIAPMPYPDFRVTRFLQIAGGLAPLLLALSLLYSVSQLVKYIVEEKEKKIRAGMQAMGLRGFVPPTAFLLVFIVQGIITAALQTLILSLSFMPESDAFLIFVVFMLFCVSSSCFAMLMSCFFSKARISGIVAPILFLMCAIPSVAIPADSSPQANRLLSFLSPSAFSLAMRLLLSYEQTTGMGWADIGSRLDTPPMAFVLFMMFFDCFLYFGLALYFDNIVKNEHGVSKSCCFCFAECCSGCDGGGSTNGNGGGGGGGAALESKQRYKDQMWMTTTTTTMAEDGPDAPQRQLRNLVTAYPDEGVVESFSPGDKPFISMCNLTKVYENPDGGPGKTAVDGMTLHLMQGHITVALGGNGAGKSTFLSMLTGMVGITSGDAFVGGYSVTHQLASTQQLLAVCPQHNLLWSQLTCMQHLIFYARIKGLAADVAELRGLELLRRLELFDKRDQDAGQLSGGQKRKLSVAIAFVAGAEFTLLDEPTAGMDVPARRSTWKLLQHMTKSRSLATAANPIPGEPAAFATTGCSILLVTHFLDEADLLGDRIAIMSAGQLHSYGSPEFLKNRLGRGYVLRLTTQVALPPDQVQAIVRDISGPAFGVAGATLNEAKGQEVTVRVPNSQVPRIPNLLRRFGDSTTDIARKYKVEAVAIEVSTMEDVFQHIADEEVNRAAKLELLRESRAGAGSGGHQAAPRAVVTDTSDALLDGVTHHQQQQPQLSYGSDDFSAQPGTSHNGGGGGGGLPDDVKKALDICFNASAHRQQQGRGGGVKARPGGSFGVQFLALSRKRLQYLRRDRRTLCFQLVVPLLCVILAMLLTNVKPPGSVRFDLETMYDPIKQEIPYTAGPCGDAAAPANGLGFAVAGDGLTTANLSQALLDQDKRHGNAERNAAWSCNDATIMSPDFVTDPLCYPSLYPTAVGSGNVTTLIFNEACRRATSVIFGNFSSPSGQAFGLANWIASNVRRIALNLSLPAGVSGVKLSNEPLPYSAREQSNLDLISLLIGALLVSLPFCFVPSTFVSFIVREKETRAKMLQRVSGVNIGAFWLSHSVFDITSYFVTELLTLIIFAISDHQEYVGPRAIGVMLVLFVVNAFATTGGGYCLSFLFDSHANAQTWTMLIGFVTGFVMVIFGTVLDQLDAGWVRWIFRLFPSYCFGEVLISVALGPTRESQGGDAKRWSMDEAGNGLLLLGIQAVVFYSAVFIVEFKTVWMPWFGNCGGSGSDNFGVRKNPSPPDAKEPWDVKEERERTEAPLPSPDTEPPPPLRVIQLRKVYEGVKLSEGATTEKGTLGRTNLVAVHNLSFTVAKGEIMGLLGTNGAGKTTTASAITGETSLTSGDVLVSGHSVTADENTARQLIGYCPQFDALFDLLTVEEHLRMYADLRGVDAASTRVVIDGLIAACDLSKYRDVIASGLSGGNKRKLSVAISLVGGPILLLLDEPSAGIDPAARRVLWDVFTYISQFCGTVLVGHHLEEIEALSHRIAIMAAGKMHCVGPLGRVKAAVGGGVEVRVRAHTADEIDLLHGQLKARVARHLSVINNNNNNNFSSSSAPLLNPETLLELVEHVEGRLTLRLPSAGAVRASISPSNLFEWLLEMQQQHEKQYHKHFEFTVSNATIEQVFLAVAQQQELKGPDDVSSPNTVLSHAVAALSPPSSQNNNNNNNNNKKKKGVPPILTFEDDDDLLGVPPPVVVAPAIGGVGTAGGRHVAASTTGTPPPMPLAGLAVQGPPPFPVPVSVNQPTVYTEFDDML